VVQSGYCTLLRARDLTKHQQRKARNSRTKEKTYLIKIKIFFVFLAIFVVSKQVLKVYKLAESNFSAKLSE